MAVGFDSSESMIMQCKANGFKPAFVGDAQDLKFPSEWSSDLHGGYDAVFSNAALHWCKRDPAGVLESAKRVLKPGGRFVIEMGGYMNCVGVRSALRQVLRTKGYHPDELDPWFFPTTGYYKSLLETHGFHVASISLHPRITPLKSSLCDWLRLFSRPYWMRDMGDEEAEEIMRAVEDICSVDCCDEQGKWTIMYVRLRVVATI